MVTTNKPKGPVRINNESGFGKRGEPMKPSLNAAVEPISGNTNVGRRKK